MSRKGEFLFRPKDKSILNYIRQKANEADRSMNKWIERLFLQIRESEKWAKEDKSDNQ